MVAVVAYSRGGIFTVFCARMGDYLRGVHSRGLFRGGGVYVSRIYINSIQR